MKALLIGVLLLTLMPQDAPSAQSSPDDQPGTATVYVYKTCSSHPMAEAGKIYYIRVQTDTGAQVTHPRLSIPSPEESTFDLKQMQPVASGDIKDKSVVSIPERFGKKTRDK